MRYAIGAGLSGLLIVGLLLCCESIAPAPSEDFVYDRGYNAGYQSGTEDTLKVAADKGLGEFFFDESAGRQAFRWFVDEASGAHSARAADAAPTTTGSSSQQQFVARRSLSRPGPMRKHKVQKLREARVDAGSWTNPAGLRGEGV
ncbi:MAG TPA: hypothetical protein VHB77_17305 [Planctomycetaceae bacterium]|nr:hypothetical protein [Planctomycetaceae bacterium]